MADQPVVTPEAHSDSIRLGPHALSGRFALAPMAEFTSWPLRLLCQEFGAALACTEMAKARFVLARDPETRRILTRHPAERLCGAQLCGSDEGELAAAARVATKELGFPFVDLNLACPIRRIVSEGAGGALLAEPAKVERLTRAAAQAAAPAPVTVKIRSGLDEKRVTAVEVAQAAQAGGAALVTVHPRTVRQGHAGKCDERVIAAVKAALRVPVMGGGDLRQADAAVRLLRETHCDLVYFARAAVGDPWIFLRARRLYETGAEPPGPDAAEFLRVFRRHAEGLCEHLGAETACRRLRRLAREYQRMLPEARLRRAFHERMRSVETMGQVAEILADTVGAWGRDSS